MTTDLMGEGGGEGRGAPTNTSVVRYGQVRCLSCGIFVHFDGRALKVNRDGRVGGLRKQSAGTLVSDCC